MAVEFKPTAYPGDIPVFWRGEAKILPGGFKPKQTFPTGTLIRRGTLLFVDFSTMEAAIIKIAKVVTGGTTTKPFVVKGTLLNAGDTVMKLGVDTQSAIIKLIDRSNASYDVVELSKAITGLAENDFLQEGSEYTAAVGETPAVPAEPLYEPNMVVGAHLEVAKSGVQAIDAAYEVVVLRDAVYPFPVEFMLDAKSPCLKLNPNILFIKQ